MMWQATTTGPVSIADVPPNLKWMVSVEIVWESQIEYKQQLFSPILK